VVVTTVIGPEEIKIKEKKNEDSTKLVEFQEVKNIQKFLRLANYYSVRIQDNRLGLFYCYFLFLFYLPFIFPILDLELRLV